MNEKKNDKPIEMPSRGRPRKKDNNLDPVFNNDFMHKNMFNSSMGYETSNEEMSLGSMCPYNVRDENKLLEQFNRIGDVINQGDSSRPAGDNRNYPGSNQTLRMQPSDMRMDTRAQGSNMQNGSIQNLNLQNLNLQNGNLQNGSQQNGNLQSGSIQNGNLQSGSLQSGILQNGSLQSGSLQSGSLQNGSLQGSNLHSGNLQGLHSRSGNYHGSNLQSVSNEPSYRTSSNIDDGSQISPKDVQNGKGPFIDYNTSNEFGLYSNQLSNNNYSYNNPAFINPLQSNNRPMQRHPFYEEPNTHFFSKQDPSDIRTPYYTNSRPILNTNNFYKPAYMRPQNYYRAPIEEPLDPWAYKKKRKNNPILWQYVKNSGDNFQSVVHPSKYSSLDYIQGSDIFSRRGSHERDYNNSILPLFLNSNKELNDEYRQIIKNFQKRVKELDFTNVTVHQLKLLMREFGLNHTGKKNELIERAKQTLKKIDLACSGAQKRAEESKNNEKNDDEYDNVFF